MEHLHRSWQVHGLQSEIRDMNEDALERLSDEDIAQVQEVAGEELAKHGYSSPAEITLPINLNEFRNRRVDCLTSRTVNPSLRSYRVQADHVAVPIGCVAGNLRLLVALLIERDDLHHPNSVAVSV